MGFVYRGEMMQGVEDHLGDTATLEVGGVEVVVSSVRRQCLDAEMLRIAGIDADLLCRIFINIAAAPATAAGSHQNDEKTQEQMLESLIHRIFTG